MSGTMQGFLCFLLVFASDAASVRESSKKFKYACNTVGGLSRNRACIFPFKNPYNGATHDACTYDHGLPAWCATRVNSDGTMSMDKDTGFGFIGFCGSDCEVEEHATCYASKSSTATNDLEKFSRLKTCVFPFEYKGKNYTECAPYDKGTGNTPFCATAVHDNGTWADWGYCLNDCPKAGPANLAIKAGGGKGRGQRCVLPFMYEDKWNVECIDKSSTDKRKWCATEVKEDAVMEKDQWGFCDGEDSSKCITAGGAKWGVACKFPFRTPWSNALHWNCTTDSLPQSKGNPDIFPNAPWCATNTDAADMMGKNDWGYCSKDCPMEKDNFCYADTGKYLPDLKKCIFPFIFNGQTYHRCIEHDGKLKCATKVNKDGIASPHDLEKCAKPEECHEKNTVNGNPVTFSYVDVASYTNDGSSCMKIEFQYSTGFEDTTNSNWNVEASVTGGFSFFGAEFEASLTAGGGGAQDSSSTSGVSHSLTYDVSPFTRVTLKQMVAKAGNIKAHTFKIQLDEVSLKTHKEINATLNGQKTENGTAVPALIPCPKFGESDDDGGDDGGDDGDDGGICSNKEDDEDDEDEEDEGSGDDEEDDGKGGTKGGNGEKKKKMKKCLTTTTTTTTTTANTNTAITTTTTTTATTTTTNKKRNRAK